MSLGSPSIITPSSAEDVIDAIQKGLFDVAAVQRELHRIASEESLLGYVRFMWPVLEPQARMADGWALEAMCEHLEAVTTGEITRLLINVPPGSMKSLLGNVFWPSWEWGPMHMPWLRTLNFSYDASLTWRDNTKFLDVIRSPIYQNAWGEEFRLRKQQETKITNTETGTKTGTSVGGKTTGERADRVVLDDPHNVKMAESKLVREGTIDWFRSSMSNRLNDQTRSAIVVIMQRVHELDVSGFIIDEELPYVHLMIPNEFDSERRCKTSIGWEDPRQFDGELYWPARLDAKATDEMKRTLGPYAYAGQYQQKPEPRGGGIIKREWWQPWPIGVSEEDLAKAGKRLEFPLPTFTLASLDTAYTEDEENDPSGLTVWGVWRNKINQPRLMLMFAWSERLDINPLVVETHKICKRLRVNRLLIEGKASGHSVHQELRRLYGQSSSGLGDASYGIEVVDPSKLGDKVARAYAIQHIFSQELVHAPNRVWADKVMSQCAIFPKGAHDDLVDTVTQGLWWLREHGMLVRNDEFEADELAARQYQGSDRPLYPS